MEKFVTFREITYEIWRHGHYTGRDVSVTKRLDKFEEADHRLRLDYPRDEGYYLKKIKDQNYTLEIEEA